MSDREGGIGWMEWRIMHGWGMVEVVGVVGVVGVFRRMGLMISTSLPCLQSPMLASIALPRSTPTHIPCTHPYPLHPPYVVPAGDHGDDRLLVPRRREHDRDEVRRETLSRTRLIGVCLLYTSDAADE